MNYTATTSPKAAKKGICGTCLRSINLTRAGLIRGHGPRCPGSGFPPRVEAYNYTTKPAAESTTVNNSKSTSPVSATAAIPPEQLLQQHRAPTLNHVPTGARAAARDCLAVILAASQADPEDQAAWFKLNFFAIFCFAKRAKLEEENASLAQLVRNRIAFFTASNTEDILSSLASRQNFRRESRFFREKPDKAYAEEQVRKLVSFKLSEGDVKGAARLASSSQRLTPFSPETTAALQELHPPEPSDIRPLTEPLPATEFRHRLAWSHLKRAIISFAPTSAAGPDGLRPTHLRELCGNLDAADFPFHVRLLEFSN